MLRIYIMKIKNTLHHIIFTWMRRRRRTVARNAHSSAWPALASWRARAQSKHAILSRISTQNRSRNVYFFLNLLFLCSTLFVFCTNIMLNIEMYQLRCERCARAPHTHTWHAYKKTKLSHWPQAKTSSYRSITFNNNHFSIHNNRTVCVCVVYTHFANKYVHDAHKQLFFDHFYYV